MSKIEQEILDELREVMSGGVPGNAATAESYATELNITKGQAIYLLTQAVNNGTMKRAKPYASRRHYYWPAGK